MATHLDLEEQEQLDQLKAFWKQYGNLITWGLIIVLLAFGGWTAWNSRQRDQSAKAGALYDELDRAAQAGDVEKTTRAFGDLKEHFGRTAYAQQAALLTARVQFDKGQADAAQASLTWAIDNSVETEYQTIARLRLAGLLLDQKKYDEGLKVLTGASATEFSGLVADRRGDILLAQGKKDEAKAAFNEAYKALDETVEYRRLVEAKLTALGAAPQVDAPKAAASGVAK